MLNKTIAALAVSASIASAASAQATDMAVVEALYTQVLSGAASPDLPARMAAVLSPKWQSIGDYVSPVKTRDQFLLQLQRTGAAAPDISFKIEEILQVGGNRFVVRSRARAKPIGPFMGVTPTDRSFEVMAIDIHTVEGHQIVTSYHVEDWLGALKQLEAK